MARVLAVSSGGGHWQQLMLLSEAFEGEDVTYACAGTAKGPLVRSLPDCNARTPKQVLLTLFSAVRLVCILRPDVVISTGAAPGVLAIIAGKSIGCRTVWIDSIANAERMSLSGRIARRFSDLWVTQWPNVAEQSGATYAGAVL
ncbi:MAG: UDP-N-acetylglucosamine--LPS N-acetylglucosamine transferase [Litoreibacter sp.]|uniref:UDP-N-acetylglucosamine--LPS N-acetylglucosamine transferase n=1 Tax=Litoreibacter sp. TaxID=1969459 RepID=UPI00329903E0